MESQEEVFYNRLIDPQTPVGLRYQAVFELKSIGTTSAIQALVNSYPSLASSVLLSHEVLYTLGQLAQHHLPLLREFLTTVVNDEHENNLSRHEAAEALANYFLPELPALYRQHLSSACSELRWTCEIALAKVENSDLRDRYGLLYCSTREPAAPFSSAEFKEFLKEHKLQDVFSKEGHLGVLLDKEMPLFSKYRVMYMLRNEANQGARETLCRLLSRQLRTTQTSLLKHEVCFILGQIGCGKFEHLVRQCIENEEQEAIVRHEALAAVASQSKDFEYLTRFTEHPNCLIRESALVAQHEIHYWND